MYRVKVFNKERNTTYVYDSVSIWDKDKKESFSKRKLVGKIDPNTGDIIPTGKRGRKKGSLNKEKPVDYKSLYEQSVSTIKEKDDLIVALRQRVNELELETYQYQRKFEKIRKTVD